MVFTLWPKEVREAVFNLKGGERQLTTSLPALQIQFMYPFISFSSFCSSFKRRKPARDSTLSFSFANSLGGRPLFVHQNIGTQRILGTQRIGENTKKICLPLLKVSSCCKLTCWWLWFDILQNLLHWMPRRRIGSNERRGKIQKNPDNVRATSGPCI